MVEANTPKTSSWKDTLRFIVIALLIIVPLRIFIAEPYIVSGQSMYPTFEDKEYLIVDRISYRLENPTRGDVIVFRYPHDPKVYYIKRIIGLPGETVSIDKGKTTITMVSGRKVVLNESYVTNKDAGTYTINTTLKSTEYFVMGDNRPVSSDSRFWGALDKKYIIGKPFISLYPWHTAGVKPGAYQFSE